MFQDMTVMVADVESGKLKRCYEAAHDEPVYSLKYLDNNKFVTGKVLLLLLFSLLDTTKAEYLLNVIK